MSDRSLRTSPNFWHGLYQLCAAIPDAWLVGDSAECIFETLDHTVLANDLRSGLRRPDGGLRVLSSEIDNLSATLGTEKQLRDRLRDAVKHAPGLIVVAQLPLEKIIGTNVREVSRAMAKESRLPVIALDPPRLERDYLDAWRTAIDALATLAQPAPVRAGTVSLVGFVPGRQEGDGTADVAALRELAAVLDLESGPFWFGDEPTRRLLEIGSSELIAGLPPLEKEAERLAARLKRDYLALPLPLGLGATDDFLRQLARRTGREEQASRHLAAAMPPALERLAPFVTRVFGGRKAAVLADPATGPALRRYLEELGFEVVVELVRQRRALPGPRTPGDEEPAQRRFDPSFASIAAQLHPLLERDEVDLVIGSSWEREALLPYDPPFFEWGFPSLVRHAVALRPHFGIAGALHLADEWSRIILERDFRRRRAR